MPNLLTTYANSCGIKITEKPTFPANYFPVPEKYITIHNGSGMEAKNYDYYSEVINLMMPYLSKNNIHVIQIGTSNEKPVEHALQYNGQTNLRQCAYIVKNALLHIGNDSIWIHYAGNYDVPVLGLYGSTLAKICGPAFCNKATLIESHRNGKKASQVLDEEPKTVNFITPEQVAKEALKLLNIPNEINIKTFFIGKDYHTEVLEVVPDFKISPNMFGNQYLNIRMDYEFNEENLAYALQFYKASISTNKPINMNLMRGLKQNIGMLIYYVHDEIDVQFVKGLHYSGIPYQIYCSNKEKLAEFRIELFDFNPVQEKETITKESIDNHEKIVQNTLFRTKKFIVSQGKVYLSLWHWKNKQNVADSQNNALPIGDAINDKDFWSQCNHYYLFNYDA